MRIEKWATVGLLVVSVTAANIAFVGLGAVFDYPAVLQRPAGEVLGRFAADSGPIGANFLLLAVAAALLIPLSALLARRVAPGPAGTLMLSTGVLAGLVQMLGLLRWPFAVPALARLHQSDPRTAETVFTALNDYLGVGVGETLGYVFTAAWTVLLLSAVSALPRWFTALGVASAAAITAGVLVPLGLPAAGEVNFVGYLAWSVWILALAFLVARDRLGVPPVALVAAPGHEGDRSPRIEGGEVSVVGS